MRQFIRIASSLVILAAASLALGQSQRVNESSGTTLNFDRDAAGKLPSGWKAEGTSQKGPVATWQIVADPTAPSKPNVMALSKVNHDSGGTYNLCWNDTLRFEDGEIDVRFKAISGEVDQGGGLIWRAKDKDNYYIARYNPLEENYRVYFVKDGKRKELASEKLTIPAGEWHTMKIEHAGDHIQCSLDGKKYLDVKDATFADEGGVGFWTKADAVTSFDDLKVAAGTASPQQPASDAQSYNSADISPRQVFVVNTGDGTVSQLDLATMKETNRFEVGPRPYGIAVTADRKTVAVGVEDEEKVKFFSLPDFKLKGETPIGKMHNDHIILTQDGKHILVANFYSDDVVGININTMLEEFRIKDASAPHVVKYGPQRKLAYVTCKKVTGIAIIDPNTRRLVKFHQINVNPRSLTFSPDEEKIYFGSFWVNGFFEMETETGKVTRLFELPPPSDDDGPQEVTYHGVEAVYPSIVLAANEGRSYVDAVDVRTGQHLDRLTTDINKPCCIELIPGTNPARVLVSSIGDGTMTLVEVAQNGKMKVIGKTEVGNAPKRVALLPIN